MDAIAYFLEKNILSWNVKYLIKDEEAYTKFRVISHPFSFGTKIQFVDEEQNVLLYAERQLFSFQSIHKIFRDEKPIATLSRKALKFTPEYFIDILGPDDYKVEGNIWGQDYVIMRNSDIIADMSNQGDLLSPKNYVRIDADEDQELILFCMILIDLIKWRRRSK